MEAITEYGRRVALKWACSTAVALSRPTRLATIAKKGLRSGGSWPFLALYLCSTRRRSVSGYVRYYFHRYQRQGKVTVSEPRLCSCIACAVTDSEFMRSLLSSVSSHPTDA